MAKSFFYWLDLRVLDSLNALKRSFEVAVPAGFEMDISDHASLEPPAVFSPVVCYAEFRSTDDYAVFLASCCPELPPSQSMIFAFATRTYGGSHQFSNFNLPCGPAFLASLNDYLEYHLAPNYPALVSSISGLDFGPQTRRLEIVNSIAQLMQPGVAAIVWGS